MALNSSNSNIEEEFEHIKNQLIALSNGLILKDGVVELKPKTKEE